MAMYQRFDPDCWKVSFNSEGIAAVVTENTADLHVKGHFRTTGDYMALIYKSYDDWTHEYAKYLYNDNFSGVKLGFSTEYAGAVLPFENLEQQLSMTFNYTDGSQKYISMGMFGVKNDGEDVFTFDGTIELSHQWIDPFSVEINWEDSAGNTGSGGEIQVDYDMDFPRGLFYTAIGSIPYNSMVTLTYKYNTFERFEFDFDNLFEGAHPTLISEASPLNIDSINLPIVPTDYAGSTLTFTGESKEFDVWLKDITVENGDISEIPAPLDAVPYRLCEGYDDEYDKNPKRLIETMALLGYSGPIDLYIGASHFYDKWGEAGEISVDTNSCYLDETKGLNEAFKLWLEHYCMAMAANNFDTIVLSVSMENLQMPEAWKQRMWDGVPGQTGWTPATCFYSPTNDDMRTYITKITKECIDIAQAAGVAVILQLGESWWWWQEFTPGDVNTPYDGRPPCFYDNATKERFLNEMGYELPVYRKAEIADTERNWEVVTKLQQYLGEHTELFKSIAQEYDVPFTTLFFPPSVLDKDRVPELLGFCNYPIDYWKAPNLDMIQIEDYDYVTEENYQHLDVLAFGLYELGYSYANQHYFAGFATSAETAAHDWPLVEKAAQQALGRRYGEVFVWAGTQIRRDSWIPKRNVRRMDTIPLSKLKKDS